MMYTATLMPKVMNLVARFAPNNTLVDLNWDYKPSETRTSSRPSALLLTLAQCGRSCITCTRGESTTS